MILDFAIIVYVQHAIINREVTKTHYLAWPSGVPNSFLVRILDCFLLEKDCLDIIFCL